MMDDRDRCVTSSYGPGTDGTSEVGSVRALIAQVLLVHRWRTRAQLAMRRGKDLRVERDQLKVRAAEDARALEVAAGLLEVAHGELRSTRATLRKTADWLRAQGWSGAAAALEREAAG